MTMKDAGSSSHIPESQLLTASEIQNVCSRGASTFSANTLVLCTFRLFEKELSDGKK